MAEPELNVGQMVADAINAYLSAAALHLGGATQEGARVEAPSATEAWLALMGASALVSQLSDHMGDAMRTHFQGSLDALLKRYAEQFPDEFVPTPGLMLT